jgi:uncharacterized cofD-like protein
MNGSKIVVLGGGHGLSALLRALRPLPGSLTAIVAVSDDGGSSGRLRRQCGMPAPGDVRSCLSALAREEGALSLLSELRLGASLGPELSGHPLGNLILAALNERHGDFGSAVDEAHALWQVDGTVLPVTSVPITLCAQTRGGEWLEGETRIGHTGQIVRVWLTPESAPPTPSVLDALAAADAILIGPGSLYTSILPTLLIAGVADAIRASPARKAYLCNLLEQPGETDGFSATDHVIALEAHLGPQLFAHVLVNTRSPEEIDNDAHFVLGGAPDLDRRGYLPVTGRYWESDDPTHYAPGRLRAFIRWLLSDDSQSPRETYPEFHTVAQRIR